MIKNNIKINYYIKRLMHKCKEIHFEHCARKVKLYHNVNLDLRVTNVCDKWDILK